MLAVPLGTLAAEFHVASAGDDTAAGTASGPFATLARARDAARALAGREPVTIHVANGIYYLPETFVLTSADSGSPRAPVIYRAASEGGAVLSGGARLQLRWQPHRDHIWKAETPAGLAIDQLFIDGVRQPMARYPNFDPANPTAAWQGFAADVISPTRAARWSAPAGGYVHAMHRQRWGGFHYRITGKNPDGTVAYEGGWQNNRPNSMHEQQRMVENIFEELDGPGEWFHDAKSRTLYFYPPLQIDLARAVVEVVRLRHLVELRGSRDAPVRHVTLQGFAFRHAARTFMDTREPLLRSDWTIYRGGAVLLTGVEDARVLDCTFDQLGGNAVFVSGYARRALIRGCHIVDAGASGVCFVGDPAAVRNPLFNYNDGHDLATIDRTPGPRSEDYPADSAVEDCLIHGIGRVERQPAGVQISMAARIAIRDTSIYDCARAGINIGDGTWGGHVIERVDVFDTVLETHDHGSFNSWGRDRFWLKDRTASERAVQADPALPFLDAVETTVIRDSRWRCDHGWDIDLDDGSSNYEITNNLMLAGGLKFREGYRRRARNNVLINGGFHPHVWFKESGDRFHSNIVMSAHQGVRVPTAEVRGAGIDRNLFFGVATTVVEQNARFGWDKNSVSADPRFLDPVAGDFRVRDDSPALALGFRNFPMDQFGVKKPSLKAIAREPVIPPLSKSATGRIAVGTTAEWFGATVRAIEGEEYSAFGVSKESGGIQLVEVPGHSAAASAGLRRDDLIQSVNGARTATLEDLAIATARAGASRFVIRYVRQQQSASLTLVPP